MACTVGTTIRKQFVFLVAPGARASVAFWALPGERWRVKHPRRLVPVGLAGPRLPNSRDAADPTNGPKHTLAARATSVVGSSSPDVPPARAAQLADGLACHPDRAALLRLARPHNIVPSVLLVFLGAWAGTTRSWAGFTLILQSLSVWVMSLVSGGVAVASCVVNDYFDFASGVDVQNSPDKPLPSGRVKPDLALLLSFALYVAVLTAACLLEPRTVRVIVAWSAALTLMYTPLLKRVTGVKNAVVAGIVAASPLAGALAAGASVAGVRVVAAPCLYAFLCILHREVLMDINDRGGDARAAVLTLPVVFGCKTALAVAAAAVAAALLFGLGAALVWGQGLAWLWEYQYAPMALVRGVTALAVLLVASPMLTACAAVWQSGFDPEVTGEAINGSMKPIGMGMLLMSVLA